MSIRVKESSSQKLNKENYLALKLQFHTIQFKPTEVEENLEARVKAEAGPPVVLETMQILWQIA